MSLIVPKCNLMSQPEVCYDTLARKHSPERKARAFADGKRTDPRRRRPEKTFSENERQLGRFVTHCP